MILYADQYKSALITMAMVAAVKNLSFFLKTDIRNSLKVAKVVKNIVLHDDIHEVVPGHTFASNLYFSIIELSLGQSTNSKYSTTNIQKVKSS